MYNGIHSKVHGRVCNVLWHGAGNKNDTRTELEIDLTADVMRVSGGKRESFGVHPNIIANSGWQ